MVEPADANATLAPKRMNDGTIMSDDQQTACERLTALARVRTATNIDTLPASVLPRWSVPLLVGPTGSGKGFVCEQAARKWGSKPCRRWNVGSWVPGAGRSGLTTTEQIRAFVTDHPAGCVVYLAGMDGLAVEAAHNATYAVYVLSEIAQLLDAASARPASFPTRDGGTIWVNPLVVAGGCFGGLWGSTTTGGNSREAWRLADDDPLAGADAVAKWLLEHSGLPSGILRRLSPEPLVLRPLPSEQADRLALLLRDTLPPAFDGLGAGEFSEALRGPHGWLAVAALVEQAWVAAHEPLPGHGIPPEASQGLPTIDSQPEPLGVRLSIPIPRTRLIVKAQRLGLYSASDLEWLAYARGYRLPGEDQADTAAKEKVGREEFTDVELTVALLSPYLPWNERAICRGAVMLAAQLTAIAPQAIVSEARRAGGELIVRHIAWMAVQLHPPAPRWRDLLALLPNGRRVPALPSGVMPDTAIRRVLPASKQ